MMLRQQNLDDERFAQIVEKARMKIAELFSPWNDLNTHDPGVMLIELFAWLTEQQRFHMDQGEEALPFFPLLGISLRRASAAVAEAEIAGGFAPRLIPAHTPLYAEDVLFEVEEDTYYEGDSLTVRIIQQETVQVPIVLGHAHGFPDTRFNVDTRGQVIVHGSFSLSVGSKEWTAADDFCASRPFDTHFTLNDETGEIVFGNGIRGAMPHGEVAVTAMALTRGAGGNIAADRINSLYGLPVFQPNAAEGGAARESVSEALARVGRDRRQAVTAEDIEKIVMETPGLCVERARAFDGKSAIRAGEPRVVHIAVKLKSGILTNEAKNKISEYLEPYRLVCREFYISTPKTISVSLSLELRTEPHSPRFSEELEASLRTFFANRYGGFGATLRISEIRAFAAEIPVILDVPYCVFRVYGGARTSVDGDISLEPDALAQLSEVSIRLLDAAL